ncbi:alpha/beta hydrolase family protein [Mycolicibacterium sp.]|uniref:alpha/beta hydrolase family protein n=1 Tax=Mycolicibacterium sp. TaxID=2320850 RepID=UPI001D3557C4|nr:alpha/beta hydrolase family protein [Mycolicibacterium sp.]MCB1290675.1 esterase family protein [Mycobacterium sp.]MCB9409026.1 esterase family protein [Mycolicibacterium sp.]
MTVGLRKMFRVLGAAILTLGVWGAAAPSASAAGVEYLMVPSAAMGRDIPVAFQGGGPHAVVLLDAFNAAPEVSNWVTVGNAMNSLAGSGLSVAAPAGGAYSMYTNWELDGSKQWETFLGDELPNWLAANKGLAPNRHAVVGAAQGGYAAMAMAAFRPDRYSYAGSLSGFLTPSNTQMNGLISNGINASGANIDAMWGAPQLGRWKQHDPNVHVQLLIDNNTRMWVFSPQTVTCSDPAAMIGACAEAQGSNRTFYAHYRSNGGRNGHFDFPVGGNHDWGNWAGQLGPMSGDIKAAIG